MSSLFRFGPFELDPDREELTRSGVDLRLRGQPVQILRLLVEKPGEVVTREEIQSAVWGDETHVGFEQGINTAIRQIRATLVDNAEAPRYVRTIPRRGYVFIAPVERIDRSEHLERDDEIVPAPSPAPTPEPRKTRRAQRSLALVSIAAILAIVLAASSFLAILVARRHRFRAAHTIAVKPFRAIGVRDVGIDERAFAEELQAAIGLLPERYVRLIAEPDGRADVVIEGTVQRTPEGLRVIASAIDTDTDLQFWSETYERPSEWTEGMAIETAHRVMRAMAHRYLPPPKNEPDLVTHVKAKALEPYRRARELRDRDPSIAQRFFEQALAAEPRFPEALSGLADIHTERMLSGLPEVRGKEVQKAADYARRALALQPCNAEAHSDLGLIALQYDYDLAAAEESLRRSTECDPEYAIAHFNLAAALASRGKFDEALTEYGVARNLDPGMFAVHPMAARLHLYARRYDDALARYRESLAVSRDAPVLLLGQIAAYVAQHRWREATTASYVVTGQRDLARRDGPATEEDFQQAYRSLEPFIREACANGTFNSYIGAAYYAEVGDHERALEWLQLAIDNHSPSVSYALVDPRLDSLRTDRRFHELLRQTKLGTPRERPLVTVLQRPPTE